MTTKLPYRISKHISYSGHEGRILQMEDVLMEKMECNRSDLHKRLIKEKYLQLTDFELIK